ncbi:MAG: GspH/FimT family protein [Planctomycetota bacterium]
MVLLAIACTAALSITAYFSRGEVTLDSAAALLTEDLRTAQARAALMRRPVMFHFDRDGGGYECVDMPRNAELVEAERPGPRRLYDRDGVFEGVRITRVDLAGRDHVLFQPDGSVAFGGRITLGFEGDSRTVELESGRSWIRLAPP